MNPLSSDSTRGVVWSSVQLYWYIGALCATVLVSLAVVRPMAVLGQGCVDYRLYLHKTAFLPLASGGRGIAVQGNLAYVTSGSKLVIVDISNPAMPAVLGDVVLPAAGQHVAVAGSFAYVADDTAGLVVVDVSNPLAPVILGRGDTPGNASDVALAAAYAYVADGSTVQVLDVSNPTAPLLVGGVDMPSGAGALAVAGNHAFVAGSFHLQVVDISNPISPAIVASVGPIGAGSIALDGDRAYMASGGWFSIVDVSNALAPAVVGSLNLWDSIWGIAVFGGRVHLAITAGVVVLDASDPASPVVTGRLDDVFDFFYSGIAVSAGQAYVACSGLMVVDVRNPVSPAAIGTVDTPGSSIEVAVNGRYAYVADASTGGLQVVDVVDPSSPTVVGAADTPGEARSVTVAGSYAYVADGPTGLQVIRISDPAFPALVGSVDTPGTANQVVVSGSYAYVADYTSLQIVDVSDPAAPRIVGSSPTTSERLAVSGTYVYTTDYNDLNIFDVSDPTAPRLVRQLFAHTTSDLALAGNLVYLVDSSHGFFRVVDVSDPALPRVVDRLRMDGCRIVLDGSDLYVSSSKHSPWIMNPSNPTAPFVFANIGHAASCVGMAVANGRLYVAAGADGLQIYPAACHSVPVDVSEFEAAAGPDWVRLTWKLSTETIHEVVGIEVLRAESLQGPYAPRTRVVLEPTPAMSFEDVDVQAGREYWYQLVLRGADGARTTAGTTSVQVGASLRTALQQPVEPPGGGPIPLLYSIAAAGTGVRLAIFDARGREVRVVDRAVRPPGEYRLVWDRRDASAHSVARGIYFVCLSAGGLESTKKLLLLRR